VERAETRGREFAVFPQEQAFSHRITELRFGVLVDILDKSQQGVIER
jgi:hypothetical protein